MLVYTEGHRPSLPTLKFRGQSDGRGRSKPSYQTQPSDPPLQFPLPKHPDYPELCLFPEELACAILKFLK